VKRLAITLLVPGVLVEDGKLSQAEARKLKNPVPYTKASIDRGRMVFPAVLPAVARDSAMYRELKRFIESRHSEELQLIGASIQHEQACAARIGPAWSRLEYPFGTRISNMRRADSSTRSTRFSWCSCERGRTTNLIHDRAPGP
jgi:hypothetical protein